MALAVGRCPDVALVDLRMPGADGLAVLRAIKSTAPDATIIIMTGYAAIDSAIEAIRLGAREYMPKPLDLKALRATLAELCAAMTSKAPSQDPAQPIGQAGSASRPAAAEVTLGQSSTRKRSHALVLVRRSDRARTPPHVRSTPVLRVVDAPRAGSQKASARQEGSRRPRGVKPSAATERGLTSRRRRS